MNRQTFGTAVVGLVAGGLGALLATSLSTPAVARQGDAAGKPYVVQVAATSIVNNVDFTAGLLFRVWSDGTLDVLGYGALSPGGYWTNMCASEIPSQGPACFRTFGIVPDDPTKPSDVNGDGVIDGADLGLLLGDWTKRPAAE